MGTNYYLHEDVCEHCGRGGKKTHIGKSSWGWCFSLHVQDEPWRDPEDTIKSLEDWKWRLDRPKTVVRDEYGDTVSRDEMIEIITERTGNVTKEYVEKYNESIRGLMFQTPVTFHPNGLMRHGVDGSHCVGNGEGPWDLCRGEFS